MEMKESTSDTVDPLDLALVFARRRRFILAVILAAFSVSLSVSLILPKIYVGTTTLLAPQHNQSSLAAAVLGQLGGSLVGSGIATAFAKNPADLYASLVKSRTIADALISRFKLQELYEEKTLVETRDELDNRTRVSAGKDGVVTIEVEDEDPKRAAAIANAYVEELLKLTQSLAITEASQRRVFFEKQLTNTKDDLAKAEVAFKMMQESTGLIKLDDQGRAVIEALATVRAQIAAREVQLTAMRTFATESNPEYARLVQEIQGLRTQLGRLEKSGGKDKSDTLVTVQQIPEAGLEHIRRFRDVKYYEALLEVFAKQYELARIDEARDNAAVQIVDRAIEPDKKSKPKRALIVILGTFLGFMLAITVVILQDLMDRLRSMPEKAGKLAELRQLLRSR